MEEKEEKEDSLVFTFFHYLTYFFLSNILMTEREDEERVNGGGGGVELECLVHYISKMKTQLNLVYLKSIRTGQDKGILSSRFCQGTVGGLLIIKQILSIPFPSNKKNSFKKNIFLKLKV